MGDGLVGPALASELQDCGAVGWVLLPFEAADATEHRRNVSSCRPADDDASDRPASIARRLNSRILTAPPDEESLFLTHCTRRQDRPWPDQPQADYLDDAILDLLHGRASMTVRQSAADVGHPSCDVVQRVHLQAVKVLSYQLSELLIPARQLLPALQEHHRS